VVWFGHTASEQLNCQPMEIWARSRIPCRYRSAAKGVLDACGGIWVLPIRPAVVPHDARLRSELHLTAFVPFVWFGPGARGDARQHVGAAHANKSGRWRTTPRRASGDGLGSGNPHQRVVVRETVRLRC
jgi:hypothetical protein